MTELIFVNGVGEELMVQVESGKILDVYTYSDSKFEVYDNKLDDFKATINKTWVSNTNPLFLHCPKTMMSRMVKRLLTDEDNAIYFSGDEDGDKVWEMLKYYGWQDLPFTLRLSY